MTTHIVKAELNTHIMAHPGERFYKCTRCDESFVQKANLVRHMKRHTGEKRFKCSLCGKTFPRAESYKRHNMWHRGERPHKCTLCGKAFILKKELNEHMRKKHPGESPSENFGGLGTLQKRMSTNPRNKRQKSTHFPKVYILKTVLDKHMIIQKEEKSYKCSVCNIGFGRLANLTQHMTTHNGAYIQQDSLDQLMEAETEENIQEDSPNQHVTTYTEAYIHEETLKQNMNPSVEHTIANKEEKLYKCSVCSERFSELRTLGQHMLTHTETYIQPDSLDEDMKPSAEYDSCTDKMTHKCWHCDTGFLDQPDLFKHITAHICFICHDIFCQLEYLYEHIKSHAAADSTRCLRCGDNFTNKYNLLEHLKTHTEKEHESELLTHKTKTDTDEEYGCELLTHKMKTDTDNEHESDLLNA